jgi:hypothetical protein
MLQTLIKKNRIDGRVTRGEESQSSMFEQGNYYVVKYVSQGILSYRFLRLVYIFGISSEPLIRLSMTATIGASGTYGSERVLQFICRSSFNSS